MGSAIMGLGISTSVKSGQGADPMAFFWEGLCNILPITIGQANLIVCAVLFAISLFIDYKQISFGTLISPIFISIFSDIFMNIVGSSVQLHFKILQSVIGILLIGVGIGLITSANLGKGVYEAFAFGVSERFNIKFVKIRMCSDLLFLIAGYVMGASIGIGPLVAVCCLGIVIQTVNRYMSFRFKF